MQISLLNSEVYEYTHAHAHAHTSLLVGEL
jgi:uncharacterized protein YjlB